MSTNAVAATTPHETKVYILVGAPDFPYDTSSFSPIALESCTSNPSFHNLFGNKRSVGPGLILRRRYHCSSCILRTGSRSHQALSESIYKPPTNNIKVYKGCGTIQSKDRRPAMKKRRKKGHPAFRRRDRDGSTR